MVGSTGVVRTVRKVVMLAVLAPLLDWTGPIAAAAPIDPDWAPPSTVYVPETGHAVERLFLDLWRTGGGRFAYGNPITPEIAGEHGQNVQYFEHARFGYWPEGTADGEIVARGAIGAESGPPPVVRRRFEGCPDGRAGEVAATEGRVWARRTSAT